MQLALARLIEWSLWFLVSGFYIRESGSLKWGYMDAWTNVRLCYLSYQACNWTLLAHYGSAWDFCAPDMGKLIL